MKELMERLSKAVNEMITAVAPGAAPPSQSEEATKMTAEAFVKYAGEQITKAKSDAPEIRIQRLNALVAQIEVAKNFEGSTEGVAIQQFKDPAQNTPTTTNVTPDNATPTTNFSAGPEVQPPGNPTTPAGGEVPPMVAPSSGFAPVGAASFAKAMDGLNAAIADFKTVAATPATPAPVTKAASKEPLWPLDLNTPFGRGETDDDNEPEWGRDNVSAK